MELIAWVLLSFLSGSIPYSVWVGRLAGKVDIRAVGDHNPGATNVLRALNVRWFLLAFLLDTLKAAIPVGLAWFFFQITDWRIVPISLAPVLGHAFSPFLRFQGGKAVAAAFGVWIGLTAGVAPTLLGLTLGVFYLAFSNSGWAVMFTLLSFSGFLGAYYLAQFPVYLWVWLAQLALLAWTHRAELARKPTWRESTLRRASRLLGRAANPR